MIRLIEPAFTEETLEKVIPQEQALLITSVANGIESTLLNNEFYDAMLPPNVFLAFAVLWGRVLRICESGIASDQPDVVEHATKTRDTALQIAEAFRTTERQSRPSLEDMLRAAAAEMDAVPTAGPSSPEDPRR